MVMRINCVEQQVKASGWLDKYTDAVIEQFRDAAQKSGAIQNVKTIRCDHFDGMILFSLFHLFEMFEFFNSAEASGNFCINKSSNIERSISIP